MTGKGIRHLNSSGSGDQLVHINIAVPKKLTQKEKQLLKDLEEQPNFKSDPDSDEKKFFKKFGL